MKRVVLFLASSLVTYLLVSTLAWPYTKLSPQHPAAAVVSATVAGAPN